TNIPLHTCPTLRSTYLVSLAHLPTAAVRSRKLRRVVNRTKEPPQIATGEGVKMGENEHEGTITPIVLKPEHRVRHMHVIGASGRSEEHTSELQSLAYLV